MLSNLQKDFFLVIGENWKNDDVVWPLKKHEQWGCKQANSSGRLVKPLYLKTESECRKHDGWFDGCWQQTAREVILLPTFVSLFI